MAVIAVLVSLISPTLAHVRNAANKVVCASNLRQVGLCLSMYRDDNNQLLPQERQLVERDLTIDPQVAHTGESPMAWSSLGWLVADGYINTPQVFYCPAHQGSQTNELYADAWMNLNSPIRTNYAYRGELAQAASLPASFLGSNHQQSTQSPNATVLVSDAFTSVDDLNHTDGFNTLSADLGVTWLRDPNQQLLALVTASGDDGIAANEAWSILDRTAPDDTPSPGSPTNYNRLVFDSN